MRKVLLLLVALLVGGAVGWVARGERVSHRQPEPFAVPRRVGLSHVGKEDAVTGRYRVWLFLDNGRVVRLEDNPPAGSDEWLMTLGPGVVVHMYRDPKQD